MATKKNQDSSTLKKGEITTQVKQEQEAESQNGALPKSLYEAEMERYRSFLENGFDEGYKFYGFTLFHSLSNEEKVKYFQELGFEPKNPEDFYNLGCLVSQAEDYQTAKKHFEKTIELAEDFEEAYYNLAVVLEKLNESDAALENWEIYMEFLEEDSSEALLISDHINELKKS